MDPEIRERLRIQEADRRQILLSLESDEPLRAGRSRLQKRRLKKLRSELRRNAVDQVSRFGRRAFRGEVSVRATISTLDDSTSTSRIIKAYLDLLKGVTYKDDRSIAHLAVDRLDFSRRAGEVTDESRAPVKVFLAIRPLRIYKEQFERAFLSSDDDGFDDEDSPWEIRNVNYDPDLAEATARSVTEWFPEATKEDLDELRIFFELQAKRRRAEVLTATPFSSQDLPDGDASMSAVGDVHPALVMLPLPHRRPRQPGWSAEVRAALAAHQASWTILRKQLAGSLALDIAVPRQASFVDLDNLAAEIVTSTGDVLFPEEGVCISTYRVYWVVDSIDALRVRVMSPMLMRDLHLAIERTQERLR